MGKLRFFDLHCDTITRERGTVPAANSFELREERVKDVSLTGTGFHVDLDNIPAAWDWCQTFALFIPDRYRGQAAVDYFQRCADAFHRQMEAHRDIIRQVRAPAELEDALARGLRGAVLSVEGGAALGGRLEQLEHLWQEGVRMMTLTWNGVNELGSGSDSQMGLTPFGREAVARMEELGIIVDVSHLNDPGFWEVARMARRPFIATHSDSRAVRAHSRNLTDDQFQVIRDMKGLVGINFCTMFLADVEEGDTRVTPEQLMAHILHLLDLGGEDCIALGSDFDGATLPAFLEGTQSLGDLREVMLAAGLGEALTDKICFQNAMDFWKRYEKTAG